ncbi:hypothetical protein GOBAR_AA32689 [Gossypium barbadense]|uniref:Disease resistance N-terminal domain-containing protein n=1 Tax=Gossypium barbadense TaxID=3634 RepID=A0A2P5WAA3_GOSBA|nr:hypothetical protein GOBAR_AA32689 [Gossypium barbadense]
MADTFVSALMSTILANLDSFSLEEIGLARSLKIELKGLETFESTPWTKRGAERVFWLNQIQLKVFVAIRTRLKVLRIDGFCFQILMAEEKQWKGEAIKNWLGKFKQTAYDMEDVLNDFKEEATCVLLKYDAIAGEKSKSHLRKGMGEAEIEWNEDRQTSSLVEELEVLGRTSEKEKIVYYLAM